MKLYLFNYIVTNKAWEATLTYSNLEVVHVPVSKFPCPKSIFFIFFFIVCGRVPWL